MSNKLRVVLFSFISLVMAVNVYAADPKFLSIGTASIGGAFYPIGIAMADIITNKVGVQTSAIVTGGAVENNTLIENKSIDIAITMGFMAYNADNGKAPYSKKMSNVNILFSGLSKGVFQIVVGKNSAIKKIEDLRGKKVALGPAGGGAIAVANDIFAFYGLTSKDFNAVYISYEQAADALTDGNIDAIVVQSAAPAPAIMNLTAAKKPIRLLSIDDTTLTKLLKTATYYSKEVLPKAMYGLEEDTVTVFTSLVVVVDKSMSEDLAYRITKAMFENIDMIKKSHPSAVDVSLDLAVEALPAAMHPGAIRYFKEKGKL